MAKAKATYEFRFLVPVAEWESFKESVGSTWFEDDEPELRRHVNCAPDEYKGFYESFSFFSKFLGDLRMVWAMLPCESKVSDDYVTDLVEKYYC